MIRDRDAVFAHQFSNRVRSLGTKEILTAVRAPKMNAYAERGIVTLRSECFDHIIVSSEAHAKRILRELVARHNQDRTHIVLGKDSPDGRPVESPAVGKVIALPRLGGLHHRYTRRAA